MGEVDLKKRLYVELGFSREIGLRWITAAREGDMRTIRDLANSFEGQSSSSLFKLLHYDGHSTTAGFVGNTALHWACANGDSTMVQFLLEKGAAVNSQNNGLSTPLHTSCANNHPHIANLLLRAGASSSLVDCCGDTPSEVIPFGAGSGLSEMIEVSELVRSGAVDQWPAREVERVAALFGFQGSLPDQRSKCAQLVAAAAEAQRQAAARSDEAMVFLTKIRSRKVAVDEEEVPAMQEAANKLREQGNALFMAGDHRGAIRMFTSGINVMPDGKLHCNRAASYLALGQFHNAVQDAQKAVSLSPTWVKPRFRLGCALRGLGRFGEAKRVLLEALALPEVSEGEGVAIRGQLSLLSEDIDKVALPQHEGRRPWFDCCVCENKTRDRSELGCCSAPICNTCVKRAGGCPHCKN